MAMMLILTPIRKPNFLPENFNKAAFLVFLKGWLTGHILYADMD